MSQSTSPERTNALPPSPPSQIQPTSPFSPSFKQCCNCTHTTNAPSSPSSSTDSLSDSCSCSHGYCRRCPDLDSRGYEVIPQSFPVHWICSTCDTTHSVLEILTQTQLECEGCDKPTLEAVYDQFGRIFLYWRKDPAVYDLSEGPEKVKEAAWRIWEAGAGMLMKEIEGMTNRTSQMNVGIRGGLAANEKGKGLMLGRHHRMWSHFSHSSITSEDSLDVELAELGLMV
ncbi:hypothetical protein QBC38DRAFT_361535 [Podospora fimiseda]|uniref:Uncharacterized protein n=1 Tax=Podospora fimiseda TaxID=252190 RepID=A0AAN7BSB9_9PEZI|nr:hypothetical protein QBC38DRAFT_361535 [Podospora fimiseda]